MTVDYQRVDLAALVRRVTDEFLPIATRSERGVRCECA
jgi:hypothetical protein